MSIKAIEAGAAYAEALGRNSAGATTPQADGAPKFADLVRDVVSDGLEAARRTETVGLQAAARQGELIDVVTAVADAELTLQTVVSIRDQVIQAYQDVIRMPI